ncbi:iron-only hydrogenase maturation protein HydE [Acetitomaculum ruminis DSM 5522]|uniref:Iron-only hydrogenase maturation protein HydE n=1 Tax=Acetitomaculum ruminis DSM 5522 TaxID=1120918 RepID=A0A1I0ZAU0_9FIRM|nr:[FeFe] hydrogenase H-cluster radical SAM maturase HydE [Acetitomaculum ruminis]SFB21353.1 iron-only hydrogenase maturation protein HydE [Acetitomaculum ruminis DSM 5522]
MEELIRKLYETGFLEREEFKKLIEDRNEESYEALKKLASKRAIENYGHDVYLRGLIEFTNYCRNDCYYCGIRASNKEAERYRLSKDEILYCADMGYKLGFRTIVLQGGEDLTYKDEEICDIIREIKKLHEDVAVTLSIGEKSKESYEAYFKAGASRYLLRHETANEEHYKKLHPDKLSLENRKECLKNLKEIGYQIGAGFMVGSPYQTIDYIIDDLFYLKKLQPHMIGIGPFIPHKDTPFKDFERGSLELTLYMLAILRLMFPKVLLPATTALGSIDPKGREKGILSGANVVMPNLSPKDVRNKYMLYDGKICTGDEAAECRKCMERRIENIGYKVAVSKGDHIDFVNNLIKC